MVLGTLLASGALLGPPASAEEAASEDNSAPVLSFSIPSPATLDAFVRFELQVSATDPDGDVVTFTVSPLPLGATFDGASGLFSWIPAPADAGIRNLTFCATDGLATTCEPYQLIVIAECHPPVANPGGPYRGVVGQDIQFDGSRSWDPSGSALTYAWDFGDGNRGAGVMPVHAYGRPGTFTVSLTVTDGCGWPVSSTAVTTATVLEVVPVTLIFKAPSGRVRTFGGDGQLVGFEMTAHPLTDLLASSMKLKATVCGTTQILPVAKHATVGDLDSDGIPDLDLVYARADIGSLLGCVANNSLVTVTVEGVTTGDHPVLGSATITVATHGRDEAIEASASPNPLNPETSITYELRGIGTATVRIYSLQGRLVRTLLDGFAGPGGHEVRWNGRDDWGDSVPAGMYLVKITHGASARVLKVVVVK